MSSTEVSERYQKLSQLEHILKRPDTYIGSVEHTQYELYAFNKELECFQPATLNIVPGLYKIFDEILVNAADNKIRDETMKNIEVVIDASKNVVSIKNDGKGIPVQIHDKEKMYIPELIFGNLLTSSNYNDDEKKVVGGRNGYGAKLCNIFSTEFEVETVDLDTKKKYVQTWSNNMSVVKPPKITAHKSNSQYTKITFKPDLAKFGMTVLDSDILRLMEKRVYDLCATVRNVKITLNGEVLKIKNFKQYIELYLKNPENAENNDPKDREIIYDKIDDWEFGVAISEAGTFNQISFVNSISTSSGGTHVKYLIDQVINKLTAALSSKKKGLNLKPFEIKNNFQIFINCLIENPSFTSQTKEQLTTRASQFKITIPDTFITKVINKTSIVERLTKQSSLKDDKALQKQDGSKKNRIKNQVKLSDANKAGTKDGYKCTLILTEGDSALSLAVSGLAVVGRDFYGCFPLRGKLLNVREASVDQILKNAEINALKQIIGLQHKKKYDINNVKTLRYGHIMIMTDQDHDGSHIKGLIINFLESSFPGLLEIPGFLIEFITPIVKVTITKRGGGKETIPFYTLPEYEKWRENEGSTLSWKQKYFKGLGTSTEGEFREYFSQLDKHMKQFHSLQEDDKSLIDLAFNKKKADDRKEWLRNFIPGTHLDPKLTEIPINDFINKELILFSMADNIRSIPSVLDGFKPGQRKVLYGCFKRNLKNEIKVAQLAGYVSEHTGYHHGEQSLVQTIIGLAQNFIGSNNLNLLKPNGGFGSRLAGGKDASAARYIFTQLNEITSTIFNKLDNELYDYVMDDKDTVEPEFYLPILPMLLVNGSEGIGTGWSTNIPSYNPTDLVNNLIKLMDGEEMDEMVPWYRGFEGEILINGSDKFKITGRIEQVDDETLEITEIPIKTWVNNMKEFLFTGLGNEKVTPWIKDVEEQHGTGIRFVVKMSSQEIEKSLRVGIYERFKLVSSINLSNMVAFDPNGRIKKYESPLEMIKDFYYLRLEYYQKRKDKMVDNLQNQLTRLTQQARFLKMIIDGELVINNRKRADIIKDLQVKKFPTFNKGNVPSFKVDKSLFVEEEVGENEDEASEAAKDLGTYDYILGMAIYNLSREKYEKILQDKATKEDELTQLLKKSAKDLWKIDLNEFTVQWEKFLEDDLQERMNIVTGKKTGGKKRGAKAVAPVDPSKRKKIKFEEKPIVKSSKSSTPVAETKSKTTTKASEKQSKLPFKKEDSDEPELVSFFGKGNDVFGTPEKDSSNDPFSFESKFSFGSSSSSSKFDFGSKDTTVEEPIIPIGAGKGKKVTKKPVKSVSKPSKSKKSKIESDLSEDDLDILDRTPKKVVKRTYGKKKVVVSDVELSDGSDMSDIEVVAPKSRTSRVVKKSYKLDSEDEEEEDEDDEESVVELDDDDEDFEE